MYICTVHAQFTFNLPGLLYCLSMYSMLSCGSHTKFTKIFWLSCDLHVTIMCQSHDRQTCFVCVYLQAEYGYPERREGHGMVATDDGAIYMFGGRDIEKLVT